MIRWHTNRSIDIYIPNCEIYKLSCVNNTRSLKRTYADGIHELLQILAKSLDMEMNTRNMQKEN